jgi:hypothetical protein
MCVGFSVTLSKRDKIALAALSPLWAPLALVGGLLYGIASASSSAIRKVSAAAGHEHLDKYEKDKREATQRATQLASHGSASSLKARGSCKPERDELAKPCDDHEQRAMLHFWVGEFDLAIHHWHLLSGTRPDALFRTRGYLSLALFSVGRVEEAFEQFEAQMEYCIDDDRTLYRNGFDCRFGLPSDLSQFANSMHNNFVQASLEVMLLLFTVCLYRGATSLSERQAKLSVQMLRRMEFLLDDSPGAAGKSALASYAIAALGGPRSVAAVRADPERMQALATCLAHLDRLDAIPAVDREDEAAGMKEVRCRALMLLGKEPIDPTINLFENTELVPHYKLLRTAGGHLLEKTTFYKPTWCDNCGDFIAGLIHQGSHCTVCSANVHTACEEATAKGQCVVQREVTDAQHRKNGNFEKRRELMLVWKRAFPAAPRDLIQLIDRLAQQTFN